MRMRLKAKGHAASPRTALDLLARVQRHQSRIGERAVGGLSTTPPEQPELSDALFCRTAPIYWGAPDVEAWVLPAGMTLFNSVTEMKTSAAASAPRGLRNARRGHRGKPPPRHGTSGLLGKGSDAGGRALGGRGEMHGDVVEFGLCPIGELRTPFGQYL